MAEDLLKFNQESVFQPPFSVWKEKTGMVVNRPEIPENAQSFLRQWDEPVLITPEVPDVDSHAA